ncbi:MAG: hypothetical protein GX616_08805, partial [Planctomycetes bacterium]|nr:hypothetical protein [Planctomycetota bacterium]
MKKFGLILLAGCLAGCDYTVPLAESPALPLDPALAGLWSRTRPDGEAETLLVLPLDKRECLVSFPAGTPDAMFGRACLAQAAGLTLAQVRWIGTARGKQPEEARVYQYADFSVAGGRLSVR